MSMENHSIPVAISRPTAEPTSHAAAGAEEAAQLQHVNTPLIDIHEGPDGLILEADLPGASENNLSIQLEDNVLVLHAKVPSPFPRCVSGAPNTSASNCSATHRRAASIRAAVAGQSASPIFNDSRARSQRSSGIAWLCSSRIICTAFSALRNAR